MNYKLKSKTKNKKTIKDMINFWKAKKIWKDLIKINLIK